ncbi:MAG TPA: 4-hydroxythreonine-4-phosphate dehydrogenase PdxA [Alphaproteobacteria bacterium]
MTGQTNWKPLALTMGEPAGISAEITLKAWLGRSMNGVPPFYVIDDPSRLADIAVGLRVEVPVHPIACPGETLATFGAALPVLPLPLERRVTPGRPDPANTATVLASIRRAVDAVRSGEAAAMVTNPINKEVLLRAGFSHPGHTEYLGELTGTAKPVMMLACPGLRVVPVTVHLPLREAISSLSTEAITHAGRVATAALISDFAIPHPRLVIAGLNPHAGEGGLLGREDIDVIAPAVASLRAEGIDVSGPVPADSLFEVHARAGYDAAVCMYHDQALIPLKTLDFEHGVDVTLGLPIVRTSPDHGTALEIAGKGVANESSLVSALRLACTIAANRARVHDGRTVA